MVAIGISGCFFSLYLFYVTIKNGLTSNEKREREQYRDYDEYTNLKRHGMAFILYIIPKMIRGLDFPPDRDYDKRNVPVHTKVKEGYHAVYWGGFRNQCREASFDGGQR